MNIVFSAYSSKIIIREEIKAKQSVITTYSINEITIIPSTEQFLHNIR